MKVDTDPSCVTRKALHPAGTPVGAITNDRPNLSVLMLGSAALLLPASRRFVLKVAGGGKDVATCVAPIRVVVAETGLAPRYALSDTTKRATMTEERVRRWALRGMRVPPANEMRSALKDVRSRRSTSGAKTRARSLHRPMSDAKSMTGEQSCESQRREAVFASNACPVSTSGPERSALGTPVSKARASHSCSRFVQV